MSQTKAQLLDNIKDNVQLDARNSLRFADTDSSHYVAFKAPATVSSNVTWTLPAADGSANYVLATDGSGTLSWIADPAGQWVTSGSNIYFTGGNVGIGDSSPSNPLSVTGASSFNGDVTFTGAAANVTWDKSVDDLIFNDNAKAAFGTSSDLLIWHNGTHSYIKDAGTGKLRILSNEVVLGNEADDETLATFIADGACNLYYNGVKKFETTSAGITVTGNIAAGDNSELQLGTGSDMILRHNGSNSFVENSTGNLILRPKTDEDGLVLRADGAAELYYDNSKKIETTSAGVSVSGKFKQIESGETTLTIGSSDAGGCWLLLDGDSNGDGAGADYAAIGQDSSGNLIVQSRNPAGTGNITLKVAGTESAIVANANGAVELYYDNSKKFATKSSGVDFFGDSFMPDGESAHYGTGNDMYMGHSGVGSYSYIEDTSADLRIHSNSIKLQSFTGGEEYLVATYNGSVDLYYNDSKKFETTTGGAKITGNGIVTGDFLLDSDSGKLKLGLGEDLQLWHDGSHSHIQHENTGNLYVLCKSGQINFETGTENMCQMIPNAEVKLYYNGTEHFQTNSTGARCIGTFQAYPSSSSSVTAGLFYNNSTGASADCRVQVKTYANQGADPYIHFDSGGTNFIVGQRWVGTTNNYLILGSGESPSGSVNGLQISQAGNGSLTGTLTENSDISLKKNVVTITDALSKVKQLRGVEFDKIATDVHEIGCIAQEVQSVIPELVQPINSVNPLLTLSYSRLTAVLIEAIKELSAEVETLKTKVAALESA